MSTVMSSILWAFNSHVALEHPTHAPPSAHQYPGLLLQLLHRLRHGLQPTRIAEDEDTESRRAVLQDAPQRQKAWPRRRPCAMRAPRRAVGSGFGAVLLGASAGRAVGRERFRLNAAGLGSGDGARGAQCGPNSTGRTDRRPVRRA